MIKNKRMLLLLIVLIHYPLLGLAGTEGDIKRHPFYVGVTGGYGSTTWVGLVPVNIKNDGNEALRTSTPIAANEGGGVWGFFGGYEVIPLFALEVGYMHYPEATITFDPEWYYSQNNPVLESVDTNTETVSVIGKLMVLIPHTTVKAYASVGGAGLHRQDVLMDAWRLTPIFGGGFNYDITTHIMGEVGANYTAGYGEAELNPAEGYFPFLYSAFVRLAYRF